MSLELPPTPSRHRLRFKILRTEPILSFSVVTLHEFVSFLRFQAKRGDWTRFKSTKSNVFPGFFAVTVGAIVQPSKRGINLLE